MTRLDDPALVASEYADESRLVRRAKGFAGIGTAQDARIPLVADVISETALERPELRIRPHTDMLARLNVTTEGLSETIRVATMGDIGPALARQERAGQDPLRSAPLPSWRRQWLIWRAARDPGRIFRA